MIVQHSYAVAVKFVISSFSPKSGVPGSELTIKGDNFRGQFGASVTMGANFGFSTVVDEHTIKVTVPTYATPGSGKLSVVINSQEALSSEVFTVLPK